MGNALRVEFTDTLMAWAGEFHVQSGDRPSTFYFRVPDAWLAEDDGALQRRVYGVARQMYEDLNAHFRQVEPDDLGYLLVKDARVERLSDAEEAARPWLEAPSPAVWEPTPCVVVGDDAAYRRVDRTAF